MNRREDRREQMMEQAQSQQPVDDAAPPEAPAAAPEPVEDDPYVKLKEAKELLDAGILTEEEFAAEKKKILGG